MLQFDDKEPDNLMTSEERFYCYLLEEIHGTSIQPDLPRQPRFLANTDSAYKGFTTGDDWL